jgi:hypothetical protein
VIQRALIYGAVAVALFGAVFGFGYSRGEIKLHEYIAEQAVARIAVIRKIETVKEEVRVVHTQEVKVIETVFVTIEKESANVPTRAACNTTYGWMFSHNHAAAHLGGAEGRVDDPADTGITEAQALAVVQANYKTFHLVAADLRACRAYVTKLAEATK